MSSRAGWVTHHLAKPAGSNDVPRMYQAIQKPRTRLDHIAYFIVEVLVIFPSAKTHFVGVCELT